MIENKMVVNWYWNDGEYFETDDDDDNKENLFTEICSVDEEVEDFSEMEYANEDILKALVKKIKNIVPLTATWISSINAIEYIY